jgi:hypothetical protein
VTKANAGLGSYLKIEGDLEIALSRNDAVENRNGREYGGAGLKFYPCFGHLSVHGSCVLLQFGPYSGPFARVLRSPFDAPIDLLGTLSRFDKLKAPSKSMGLSKRLRAK